MPLLNYSKFVRSLIWSNPNRIASIGKITPAILSGFRANAKPSAGAQEITRAYRIKHHLKVENCAEIEGFKLGG